MPVLMFPPANFVARIFSFLLFLMLGIDVKLAVFRTWSSRLLGPWFFFRFPVHFSLTLVYSAVLLLLMQTHRLLFSIVLVLVQVLLPCLLNLSNFALTFSLTFTAIRSCSSQFLNCLGGSEFVVVWNTGIPIYVWLSWVRNSAGCSLWYSTEIWVVCYKNLLNI